ncbi:MAG TPA: cytochrome c oxidase assembly protein [Acidimicrobiales bacterium]|nr:cytochrome c oxidase assembly protein [Acidimicrobiales bacterium]
MAPLHVDPAAWALCAAGSAGYVVGVRRLAARRADWPQWRSAAMAAAVVALLVATTSPLGDGGADAGGRQAISQSVLVYGVPLLLAWAAPHTLAIEAGGRGTARRVRKAVGSRALRVATSPPVAITASVGVEALMWLTSLHSVAARHEVVAEALQVWLLAAGCAYLWPVFGADPLPRRLPHVASLVHILVLLPLSTLVGMATEASAVGAHQPHAVVLAGGVVWAVGTLGSAAAAVAVLVRWLRVEERAAPGRDAGLDEAAHAQLVAWRAARDEAAAEDAARRAAYAARRR